MQYQMGSEPVDLVRGHCSIPVRHLIEEHSASALQSVAACRHVGAVRP